MDMDAPRCALKKSRSRASRRSLEWPDRSSTQDFPPLRQDHCSRPKPATRGSHHIGYFLLNRRGKLPIEKFITHDLRRTVATMLAEKGVALDLIAAIIGHESGGRETERWFDTTAGRQANRVVRLKKTG